jgi:hypothetical protein
MHGHSSEDATFAADPFYTQKPYAEWKRVKRHA